MKANSMACDNTNCLFEVLKVSGESVFIYPDKCLIVLMEIKNSSLTLNVPGKL